MAVAIGHTMDIPMLLRILASHLYQNRNRFTLVHDRNLFLTVNATIDPGDESGVVKSYPKCWWLEESELDNSASLNFDDLDRALAHHLKLRQYDGLLPENINKQKYTWSHHLSTLPEGVSLKCENCWLYCGVTLRIMDNLQDIRNIAHLNEVSSDFHTRMSERRAVGFFQLYNAALMKEMETISKGKVKGKMKVGFFIYVFLNV